MRDLTAQPSGLVRLTASQALGRQHIAPHIERFVRASPGIRVERDVSDRLVTLAHEGFDLAIRHTGNPKCFPGFMDQKWRRLLRKQNLDVCNGSDQ